MRSLQLFRGLRASGLQDVIGLVLVVLEVQELLLGRRV